MNSKFYHHFLRNKALMLMIWILFLLSVSLLYVSPAHGEDPFFSIALSKFSNERDAAKEEARLKNSGHNAFFRKEKSSDNKNTIYQVYIEKYNSMDEAEKEARVLNDLELISDYTVREITETPETFPASKITAKDNEPEKIPIPPPDGKKEQTKPGPVPGEKTTAPEPNPVPEKKTNAREPAASVTKEHTAAPEPSPAINGQKNEPPPELKKTELKPDQKAEPEKKPVKFTPVINHDDERLTGASLQVGAFSDEANAASIKTQLKNMGRNAFYRHESADGKGEFYRLYITGYASLREAIKDAKTLLESGVISGYSRVHSNEPVSDTHTEEKIEKTGEGKVYILHISSNKDETNAAENVAKLKEYGFKAFYLLEKSPSDSWYRVYIGGFKDEAKAREKGKELLDRGLISYFKPMAIDRKKLDNLVH